MVTFEWFTDLRDFPFVIFNILIGKLYWIGMLLHLNVLDSGRRGWGEWGQLRGWRLTGFSAPDPETSLASLSLCPRINRPVHRKPPTRKSYSQKHTARVIFLPNTVHYQLRSCQVQSIIQKIDTQYILHWICVFQQTQWLRVGAGLMVAR